MTSQFNINVHNGLTFSNDNSTLKVNAVSGTDTAGKNLTIAAGQGTGTGDGGSIIFQTADGDSGTGSSANSLVTAMTIADDGNINIPGGKSLNFGEGDDTSLTHIPYMGFNIDGNLSSNKSLVTDGSWTNIGDIDGTTDDGNAGFSVSINSDGSTIAYGIPGHWYDNDPSGYQGEVIIKTYSGSGSTWNDLGETIIGENNLDDFGISVSLNSGGRTIVIGGNKNNTNAGHVRIFEYSEFTSADSGNYYHQSQTQDDSQRLSLIATSSTSTAPVVGTSYWKQKGFDIDGESISNNDDYFGTSVDINSSGNIIAVGAQGATIADGTADRGHVRLYKYSLYTQTHDDNSTFHYSSRLRNGTQTKPLIITPSTSVAPVVGNYYWTQMGDDIDANTGDTSNDTFGFSVSLNSSGTRVAIGSYKYNTRGYAEIYEYSESSDSWTQLGSDIQGVDSTDSAGISVSLNALGDVMAIGSQIHDSQKGHVRIFRYIEGSWTQLGGDIDGAGTERLSRGLSFSDDGNIISMGARNYNSGDGRVKVYRYVASSNSWSLLGSEIAGETGEKFGVSTDISSDGTRLIVGTQVDGGNGRGSVRIYDLTSQTTSDSGWISGRDHIDSKYKISCSNNIQDSTKLTIDTSGNVCISGNEGQIKLKSTNGSNYSNILLESSGGDQWQISGPRGATEGNLGFYYVDGGIYSSELLSIKKDGRVGINTDAPDSVFSIRGDNGGTSGHQATLTIRNTTVTNSTENGLWRIFSYVNNNYGYLYFYNSTSSDAVDIVGYLDGPAGNQGVLDFTGQHKSLMNKNINTTKVGLIVISTNNYINLDNSIIPNINESLSYCALSNIDNDKRVFGVISDKEDTNMSREYANGNFVSVFGKKNNNEQRLVINSLGEGAIWICNKNGSLDNGDYITSTTVTGYGVKQSDDILHNYTVAKITCDCHFSLTKIVKQKLKVTIDGTSSSIDYDTEGDPEYEDDLDENGNQQMVYPLETRFLQADGTLLTDEADYTTRLGNGEEVYIACFVGCTYHCG